MNNNEQKRQTIQKNITFEDYCLNITDDDCSNWAYICDECAKKYNINPALLDNSGGDPEQKDSPLCSIKSCQNKANAYIDLPKDIPTPANASPRNIPEWKIPLEKLQCKTIPTKNNTKTKMAN